MTGLRRVVEPQVPVPPPPSAAADARGFSLAEMLVAMLIVLAVLASLLTAVIAAQRLATVQPEMADMQQRLRVGTGALVDDIEMAGAGGPTGCGAGPLYRITAPIRPYRAGLRSPSPPGSFDDRAITVIHIPPSAPVAVTSAAIASPVATVPIAATRGSGMWGEALGFQPGTSVGVFSDGVRAEFFQVVSVRPAELSLHHMGQGLARPVGAGACVREVRWTTYQFDPGVAGAAGLLMRYDGFRSEQPVVDQVVALRFAYFGEADPPAMIRDASAPDGPWTTYGPRPPPPADDDPLDAWGPGENCVFGSTGIAHVPRLDALGPSGSLVPLTAGRLADGPWCPDVTAPNRFDADLLRIRRVVVTIRFQAVADVLRGPAGVLFARAGLSRSSDMMAPDVEATVDVTPPNLSVAR